jgi:hypothetical protein
VSAVARPVLFPPLPLDTHPPHALVTWQVTSLGSDLVTQGVERAVGGIHYLRVPWLLVEGPEALTVNRDGEPTPDSKRCGVGDYRHKRQ